MKKILITLFILICSLPLFAQRQIELKELQPKAAEVIPVKVEMIDNQEVLTVSSYNHSIQIPLTAESKTEIDVLLEAAMGTTKRVKDINGAGVSMMKVTFVQSWNCLSNRKITKGNDNNANIQST